jgi:hypothetical protein
MVSAWMLTTALAVGSSDPAPAPEPQRRDEPAPVYTLNTPEFRIPVNFARVKPEQARSVLLFVSADRGQTWSQHAEITPDQKVFEFSAKEAGEYWFVPVVVHKDGTRDPADVPGAVPVLKVRVDDVGAPAAAPRPGRPPEPARPTTTRETRLTRLAEETESLDEELAKLELDLIRKEMKRLAGLKELTVEEMDRIDRLRSRLGDLRHRIRTEQPDPRPRSTTPAGTPFSPPVQRVDPLLPDPLPGSVTPLPATPPRPSPEPRR